MYHNSGTYYATWIAEPGKAETSVLWLLIFLNWHYLSSLPELPPMAYKKTDLYLTEIFKGLGFASHQFTFQGQQILSLYFSRIKTIR